jgi:hypothetical protein
MCGNIKLDLKLSDQIYHCNACVLTIDKGSQCGNKCPERWIDKDREEHSRSAACNPIRLSMRK